MPKVKTVKKQSFEVTGERIVDKVKKIIQEGNARKIMISKDGKTVAEFPLTFGIVGTAIAPVLAAVSAIAALLTKCTITVEKEE